MFLQSNTTSSSAEGSEELLVGIPVEKLRVFFLEKGALLPPERFPRGKFFFSAGEVPLSRGFGGEDPSPREEAPSPAKKSFISFFATR
jgi:hypothetical protein